MSRYPPTPTAALPGNLRPFGEEADNMASGAFGENGSVMTYALPNGALIGPFPVLVASKHIMANIKGILESIEALQAIPADAKEVALLVTAARFGSPYEAYAHGSIAVKTGALTQDQCKAIAQDKKPQDLSDAAAIAYDAAHYLVNQRGGLPQDLYDKAVTLLGKEGVLKLAHGIAICSYMCVLMNLDDTPLPPGEA